MFVRVLFLLLLALDIGAACWLYFAPRAPLTETPATDAGVAKLVLLSEADHSAPAVMSAPLRRCIRGLARLDRRQRLWRIRIARLSSECDRPRSL